MTETTATYSGKGAKGGKAYHPNRRRRSVQNRFILLLDDADYALLGRLSAQSRQSMAEVVRQGIRSLVPQAG